MAWSETKIGQTVFVLGHNDGVYTVSGPHVVVDPDRRLLANSKGSHFTEHGEVLVA